MKQSDDLDPSAVTALLREKFPELTGPAHVQRLSGGSSNWTYLLQYQQKQFVLRRPPAGTRPSSGHQMWREYRVMNALREHYPVPRTYLYSADEAVIGAEFYVMEHIEGLTLAVPQIPAHWNFTTQHTRELADQLWEHLISLHRIDYRATELENLGKPVGYVRRQVEGWSARCLAAATPDSSDFVAIRQWLSANMPPTEVAHCVVHGDYRLDNCMLDATDPRRIIAVLDWEISTIGDPLMDLGCALAYWTQADDPPHQRENSGQPSYAPGMPTREEIFRRHLARMNLTMSWEQFQFYLAFGYFRNAIIKQQIYYRYFHGESRDPRFAALNTLVNQEEGICRDLIASLSS